MNLNPFFDELEPLGFEDELDDDPLFSGGFESLGFDKTDNDSFFDDEFDALGFDSEFMRLTDTSQENETKPDCIQPEEFMSDQMFSILGNQYVVSPDSRYLLKANVGDRKSVKGVTYILNDNHRWAREDGNHLQSHEYPVILRQLTRDRDADGLRALGEQAWESQSHANNNFWAEPGVESEAHDLANLLESGRKPKVLTPKKAQRQITAFLNQKDADSLADLAETLEGLADEHEGTPLGDDYNTLAGRAGVLSLQLYEDSKTPEELELEEKQLNDSINQTASRWENLQSKVDELKGVIQSRYELWQQSQQSLQESSKILEEKQGRLTPADIDSAQKLQFAFTIAFQKVDDLDEQIKTQQEQLKSLFSGEYASSWKPVERELQRLKFGL